MTAVVLEGAAEVEMTLEVAGPVLDVAVVVVGQGRHGHDFEGQGLVGQT